MSVSDNAHLLSESRRAMMFMEENERNAVGKLVVSSVPTGSKGVADNIQLWYTHVRRLYFQCVDKRSVRYTFDDYYRTTHITWTDARNTCLFQCDILPIQELQLLSPSHFLSITKHGSFLNISSW